jgi:hypothetical protein
LSRRQRRALDAICAGKRVWPAQNPLQQYVRWDAKGVWVNLFQALARAGGPSAQLLIDSSAVKAPGSKRP